MKILRFKLSVADPQGRPMASTGWRPSRSYVRAMDDILQAEWSSVSLVGVIDTTNNARNWGIVAHWRASAPATNALYGPVVGRGMGGVGIGNYQLGTQVLEGVGLNQMNHQVTAFTNPVTVGSTRSFTIQRVFVNNSALPITLNECGLYIQHTTGVWYFCLVRDLISGGLLVPIGGSATLTYTIGVSA